MWQHVKLSEQIRPRDTLACCWDVKQASKQPIPFGTVPYRTVLARPDDLVTCPYHFSLRLSTEVRTSSYGPMAFPVLVFTYFDVKQPKTQQHHQQCLSILPGTWTRCFCSVSGASNGVMVSMSVFLVSACHKC